MDRDEQEQDDACVRGGGCLFLTLMQGCVWACVSGHGSAVRYEASSPPFGCGREQNKAGWDSCVWVTVSALASYVPVLNTRTLQEQSGGGPGEKWRQANPRNN